MNKPDKDKLLQQFIEGSISAEDRRLLEIEALQDDFLFDAMEGYTSMGKEKMKIDNLRTKLYGKAETIVSGKEAKRRSMWLPGIAIAASFLLVASLFWWNSADDSASIAGQYASAEVEDRAPASPQSSSGEGDAYVSNSRALKTDGLSIDEPSPVKKAAREISMETEQETNEIIDQFLNSKPTAKATIVEAKPSPQPQEESEEEILADLPVGDLNWEDRADYDVETELGNSEDVFSASVEEKMQEDLSPPPAPTTSVTEEVVASGISKKEMKTVSKASRRQSNVPIVTSTMEADSDEMRLPFSPTNGWDEFNRYIEKNKVKDPAAIQANINGSVLLEFMLDATGKPIDIEVVKSDWTGFNNDAIELIRLGGKWNTTDTTKPIQYEIRY